MTCECEPVGINEIADRLHVTRWAVDNWRREGSLSDFPAHRWEISGKPAWNWPDVEKWAKATRRL